MTDEERKSLRMLLAEQRRVCERKEARRRMADPKHRFGERSLHLTFEEEVAR